MAVHAQHTLDVLDHRIQDTMSMIRRASEPHADVAFPCYVCAQHLDQGGFANAGFPAEKQHLPQPRLTLFPAAQEESEFLLAPPQEGQSGRGRLSLVTRRLPRAENPED